MLTCLMKFVSFVPDEYLEYQDSNGNTIMHVTASNGDIDTLLYLIHRGVNTNVKNNKGWTPMMYAVRYKFTECARALVKASTASFIESKL